MAHADDTLDLRTGERSVVLVLNMDQPFLHDYIRKLYGGNAPQTDRCGPRLSLATPGGMSFWRYLSFMWSACTQGGPICQSPLVLKEMEDALVAVWLYALDDQDGDMRQGGERGYPAYLRRAEDYIVAHLEAPVSLADITEVAGVSARSLSKAFRKRHGTGPQGFLQARRLEAAQRALLVAAPESTTVAAVAQRFGFWHLGRFAADYCQAFQEHPSETLRR